MSDMDTQRRILLLEQSLERLRKADVGIPSSTSFPSSPPAGMQFYRPDLNFLCVYDGAHWLTVHEYEADLTAYVAGSTARITVTNSTVLLQPFRTDYSIDPTRAKLYCDVLATNNGTNFWSFTVGSNTTSIWAPTTAADSAGVGINKEAALGSVLTGNYWQVGVTKTGSPGGIAFNVSVYYRLIIT